MCQPVAVLCTFQATGLWQRLLLIVRRAVRIFSAFCHARAEIVQRGSDIRSLGHVGSDTRSGTGDSSAPILDSLPAIVKGQSARLCMRSATAACLALLVSRLGQRLGGFYRRLKETFLFWRPLNIGDCQRRRPGSAAMLTAGSGVRCLLARQRIRVPGPPSIKTPFETCSPLHESIQ